ncbi:MAG TPA: CotH kinase family protein [Solirubrobacterales bacterium]|nr:CotH kinase family protein [Solirubrobacterales bacterium]
MRLPGLALALVGLAALWAPAARADDAAQIYDPSTVFFVDLALSPTAEAELEAEPDEYVAGSFELTASSDGTPAGEEPTPLVPQQPAEIRLKGSEGGSFRRLDEKPGFKLKFDDEEPVLGLHKMTLNNMVQDPSMVHETLAYAAFRANGIPAPRTGFAYVRLNGQDIGVYLDLENLDDIALTKIFGSFDKDAGQHLYEGEYGDDVVPGAVEAFEPDEGKENHREDLEALIEAVNGDGSAPWSQRVAPHADLLEMARFWAVEKYIDHWDGYSGHVEPSQVGLRPNNYYLYSDPAGVFQMLPWGTDQTWIPTLHVPGRAVTFDGSGGVLFNKCLEDDECFHLYWDGLNLVTHTMRSLDPVALAEDTAALLAPWQEEEREEGRPDPEADEAGEIEDGVEETLGFAAGRQAEAEEWLAENEPAGEGEEPSPEEKDSSGSAGNTPASIQASPSAGPALLLGRSSRSGRQLITRVEVGTPGRVRLRATFRAGGKRKLACSASRRVRVVGRLALRCRLSDAAMRRLARHALSLRLSIAVVGAGGKKRTVVHDVRLPKR